MKSRKHEAILQSVRTHQPVVLFFMLIFWFPLPTVCGSEVMRLEKDGVVIEYPPEFQSLAERLHPWLKTRLSELSLDRPRDDWLFLAEKRQEIEAFVREQLALEKPEEGGQDFLKQIFDQALRFGEQITAHFPDLSHIRLWRKEELIACVEEGKDLPGISYDRESGEFSASFFYRARMGKQEESLQLASLPDAFPIYFEKEDDDGRFDEAKKRCNEILETTADALSGIAGGMIHEVAESSMLSSYLMVAPYRRWFADGVANYIAWAALKKFSSEAAAGQFLRSYDVKPYLRVKQKVNLGSWLAAEAEPGPPTTREGQEVSDWESQLQSARYAFATHEIMGLVERHGEEVIPTIFSRIRRIQTERAKKVPGPSAPGRAGGGPRFQPIEDFSVVLDIIEQVTGEDFRARLLEYSEGPPVGHM